MLKDLSSQSKAGVKYQLGTKSYYGVWICTGNKTKPKTIIKILEQRHW